MATYNIRLPKDSNINRWAAPLSPLAMTFMATVAHANIDAAASAARHTQMATPHPEQTEPQT